MTNPINFISAIRNCTPSLAKTLKQAPKIEKSISSMAKTAQSLQRSEVGSFFKALSDAGQEISGAEGIISITTREAKNTKNATIITVTVSKGKEIVGKIAGLISQKGRKIGGSINGTGFYYSDNVVSNAARFRELAQKLGVDINIAMRRLNNANGAGAIIKDEKAMADIILGKYQPKTPVKPLIDVSEKVRTAADPISMDEYFKLGYGRMSDEYTQYPNNLSKIDWVKDSFEMPSKVASYDTDRVFSERLTELFGKQPKIKE